MYFDFGEADRLRAIWISSQGTAESEHVQNEHSKPRGTIGPLAEAQARERHFKASLAELEYRKQIGQLLERERVEAEAFRLARMVRDAILNIPSRLAGILAAETDQRKAHDLLERELRQALESLAAENPGSPAAA